MIEDAINEDRGKAAKSIDSLRLSVPEFGQNATLNKEQFWFRYEGEYESTENGSKIICSDFVIRLVKEVNSINWKVEWEDKGKCKPIDEQ